MAIVLTVANESNENYTYHGADGYYLSKGKTVESAKNNIYVFICKQYEFFEYESNAFEFDIKDLMLAEFEKQYEGECWSDVFSESILDFITEDGEGTIEIPEEVYNLILEI